MSATMHERTRGEHNAVSLESLWMPFTANRAFKQKPRLLVSAKDMYYTTVDGRQVLDGAAGLWCVNAGHGRERIVAAIRAAAGELDYAPSFQMGHPIAFELADRLVETLPGDLDHVFFANSGSEAVDTALKIALAYHQARGDTRRTRLIGRSRGYHGVGFGGISVGGIENNRKQFPTLLPGVLHLPDTHDIARNAFSRGQPMHGAERADALEAFIKDHGAETIAAVIVEPLAGSAGVLVPPSGYLERLALDLRSKRHPPDLRRGDHRLRAIGGSVRGGLFRHCPRHHDACEGPLQRLGPDGSRVRAAPHLRYRRQRRGPRH